MQLSTNLIAAASLLGLASAQVGIGFWSGNSCTGSLLACPDVPPLICCQPPSGFSLSVEVVNKPAAANYLAYYEDTAAGVPCGTFIGSTTADGSQDFCVDVPDAGQFWGGGAYDDVVVAGAGVATTQCTQSVQASELRLADGRTIDVADMNAEEVDAIMRLSNGGSAGQSAKRVTLD